MRVLTSIGNVRPPWRRQAPPTAASPQPAVQVSGQRLFDEELLARLRRLALVSRRANHSGLAGEHRSRRRGSAPEFADFRSYSHGEDFRRIDWNTYARLGSLFIRLSEVTTELTVHILLDASNSMNWRGTGAPRSKFDYARRVAGAIGYIALWHFDRVTVAPFGSDLAAPFGPAHGRTRLLPMLHYLEAQPALGGTDLPAVVERYFRSRRQAGVFILVSDLLSGEPNDLTAALRLGRERGWQMTVVHIVDERELDPAPLFGSNDTPQSTELIDVEQGERLRLAPTEQVLTGYQTAVTTWLGEVEAACTSERSDYVRLQTSWPLEDVVLRLLYETGVVA